MHRPAEAESRREPQSRGKIKAAGKRVGFVNGWLCAHSGHRISPASAIAAGMPGIHHQIAEPVNPPRRTGAAGIPLVNGLLVPEKPSRQTWTGHTATSSQTTSGDAADGAAKVYPPSWVSLARPRVQDSPASPGQPAMAVPGPVHTRTAPARHRAGAVRARVTRHTPRDPRASPGTPVPFQPRPPAPPDSKRIAESSTAHPRNDRERRPGSHAAVQGTSAHERSPDAPTGEPTMSPRAARAMAGPRPHEQLPGTPGASGRPTTRETQPSP